MNIKQTITLLLFGLRKIPLIFFVRPRVIELDHEHCILKIPLRRRTRNHLNSMYFGALAIGADLASGLLAMDQIHESGHKISLVFKDMHADFIKRVDGDAVFTCNDGKRVRQLIQRVVETGERHHQSMKIIVTSPDLYGDEILAEFSLTLSLKKKEGAHAPPIS